MRVEAKNHAGWVVQEFKKCNKSKQIQWVDITLPDNWANTMVDLEKHENLFPLQQFRIYEALTEDYP